MKNEILIFNLSLSYEALKLFGAPIAFEIAINPCTI